VIDANPAAPAAKPPLPPGVMPGLLNSAATRAYCGDIGETLHDELMASGRFPAPVKSLGRRNYWRTSDLALWVSLGCPERRQFEAAKIAADLDTSSVADHGTQSSGSRQEPPNEYDN
jgi:predicted DNA-binding transcriptional regulator AlpA